MTQAILIAACGWFLLVPSVGPSPDFAIEEKQTYGKWEQRSAHDTARECEREKDRIQTPALEYVAKRANKAKRWAEVIKELEEKGKNNWTEEDWRWIGRFAEYLRTEGNKTPSEDHSRMLAVFSARCIPTDVLLSPKR